MPQQVSSPKSQLQERRELEDMLLVDKIPHKSWNEVKHEIYDRWKPDDAPHHSIICITGGGKSYLYTRGLLPMRGWRKNVIIDIKGDDKTLDGVGRRVRQLPQSPRHHFWQKETQKPSREWYRLVVYDDWNRAREQVRDALARAYAEGDWTIYIDETRHLTDGREPSLGLRPYVEQVWLRGRSRRVEVVAATQAPRWVPSSFYDQPSFVWIGRINDERAHQRLREVGGLRRSHLPIIQRLQKRQFLVIGDGGDYTAITRVPDLAKQRRTNDNGNGR